jgi:hypothetical protein
MITARHRSDQSSVEQTFSSGERMICVFEGEGGEKKERNP